MEPQQRFISVDDHVQEQPRVWTDRLDEARWGDRIPHVARQADGTERWGVDGQVLPLEGVALAAGLTDDHTVEPQRWDDVPAAAYDPQARLQLMDAAAIERSVLYPTVAGLAG